MFLCSRLCYMHRLAFSLLPVVRRTRTELTVLLDFYTSKLSYYAVAKGRNVGIYNTWEECKAQTNKYSAPVYKKFRSKSEAEQFIKHNSGTSSSSTWKPKVAPQNQCATSYTSSYFEPSKRSMSTKCDSDDESTSLKRSKIDNEEFFVDSNGFVEVYTDGACIGNGRGNAKAGIGVWFSSNNKFNVSRPVENGRATNNYAEINAITNAAKEAQKAGIKKLKINTDSKFVISCITEWMPSWKKRNWKTAKGEPVINKQELIEMEKALAPLEVTWNHVRGHVGVHGNEMADKLARAGAERYRD